MELHGYFGSSASCARRFGVEFSAYPHLFKAGAAAQSLKAFADAAPDRQPDAE